MATISDFDVVIAGGSFGGCAAALAAAADEKVKVVLLEAGEWIGGQATSQGLTRWDETAAELTESTGSPKSYRDLRDLIRAEYPDGDRSDLGKLQEYFNPGFAGVGPPFTTMKKPPLFRDDQRRGHPFAADPKVVLGVLTKLLKDAGVTVKTGAAVIAADVRGRVVRSLTVRTGPRTDTYTGKVFLDATDLGDLLPLCNVPFAIGAEAQSNTHEKDAEKVARPEFIQPFTVPIAVRVVDKDQIDKSKLVPKPPGYDEIRRRQGFDRIKVPEQNENHTVGDGDIKLVFNPAQEGDTLVNYRQFIDRVNFADKRPWRTTLNVGGNDFLARAIPSNPEDPVQSRIEDARIVEEARQVSRAYLYFVQNDVPGDPGHSTGYPEIQLDTATFDRADGTAPAPYIRESRRLKNPHVRVVRSDIDMADHGGNPKDEGSLNAEVLAIGSRGQRAKNFPDSCGIGQYGIDVHAGFFTPTGNPEDAIPPNIGGPERNFQTVPFQIPLGALLPKELDNFVAACKNIGTTHLTSGAYRVHPVEWAIGEAAGELAAYCTTQNLQPGGVADAPEELAAYQSRLLTRGAPIFWWDDVPFEKGARTFAAVHLLGARGIFEGDGETRNFYPTVHLSDEARADFEKDLDLTLPDGVSRGDAAVLICEKLRLPLPP